MISHALLGFGFWHSNILILKHWPMIRQYLWTHLPTPDRAKILIFEKKNTEKEHDSESLRTEIRSICHSIQLMSVVTVSSGRSKGSRDCQEQRDFFTSLLQHQSFSQQYRAAV